MNFKPRHFGGHRSHSLSSKLLLLFIVMGVIFLASVGAGMGHVFRNHFDTNLRPLIHQYVEYVYKDIGQPADFKRARQLAEKLNLVIYIQQDGQFWSSNNQDIDIKQLEYHHRANNQNIDYGIARAGREELFFTRNGNTTILFDIPNLHQERNWRGFMPLTILLLVLIVLYHFTRRLISPIDTIKQGIQRFSQGDLRHRIQVESRDELGELAKHINLMAGDIEQMLEAKRQLLLAISHELRSPITRAKVSTELMDDNQQRQQIVSDLNEMENLIGELIETEKLSTEHRILNKTEIDLVGLIQNVVKQNYSGQVKLQLPDALLIHADSARIKLLLRNLIDNALRHSNGKQAPQIQLNHDRGYARLTIRDYGEGIEEQHIPHLTEPFYRVDPSRQRQTGGFGLGLYLCRLITEAHGGALSIESKADEGTTITATLAMD